jgi:hypothetical protein
VAGGPPGQGLGGGGGAAVYAGSFRMEAMMPGVVPVIVKTMVACR